MSDRERALNFDEAGNPESEEEEISSEQLAQTQQIIQTGGITATKGKYPVHCLTVVGQIEGHYILPPQNKTTKYEHVIPQLVAIEENPEIEGLIIILNTVGGDVEAGLAIAELVSGMKKPTVSLVLGGGHSIGVPLAVSAKVSFIAPSATMTIHPVRMNGLVLGVPQTLSYFDKMQERIVRFVVDNSRIGNAAFRKLMMQTGELVMDVGTVLDGKAAVNCGLIDHLGGLHDAIAKLYELIDERKAEPKATRKKESKAAKGKGKGRAGPAVASPRAIAQLAQAPRPPRKPRAAKPDPAKPGRGRPRKNLPAAASSAATNKAALPAAKSAAGPASPRAGARKRLPEAAPLASAATKGTAAHNGPFSPPGGAPVPPAHAAGTGSSAGAAFNTSFPVIGPQGSWVSGPQSGWVSRGGVRYSAGAASPVLMDAAVPIHPAGDRTPHQPAQAGHTIEGTGPPRVPGGNARSGAAPSAPGGKSGKRGRNSR